jgi:hypothetical protein
VVTPHCHSGDDGTLQMLFLSLSASIAGIDGASRAPWTAFDRKDEVHIWASSLMNS